MSPKIGIVLSGGGARGAYEAGVLHYLLGELQRTHRAQPPFHVICGTSVGAVNGAAVGAFVDDPAEGAEHLWQMWSGLDLDHVLRFGVRQLAGLHRVLLGGRSAGGFFDAGPLAQLVRRTIPWRRLARNLRQGRFDALTITSTHVATGRPVLFYSAAPHIRPLMGLPRDVIVRRGHLLPPHVLASASIPLLFPPVRIGTDLYCDGGLRLNTPIAPALRLGVDRLLVIGVAMPSENLPPERTGRFPGAPFLLGKVLNAFLLDHVMTDLDDLNRMNAVLEDARRVGGEDFLDRLNVEALHRGHPPRRIVRSLAIRPSADIGRMALEYLRTHRMRFGRMLGRSFFRLLELGEGQDADLASYLLFDNDFVVRLMQLGLADARARRSDLIDFFG